MRADVVALNTPVHARSELDVHSSAAHQSKRRVTADYGSVNITGLGEAEVLCANQQMNPRLYPATVFHGKVRPTANEERLRAIARDCMIQRCSSGSKSHRDGALDT